MLECRAEERQVIPGWLLTGKYKEREEIPKRKSNYFERE